MTLAPFVRIVAQGKGRARAMSRDEAFSAMQAILSGAAAPEAVGALLMVLRLRGEEPQEIAGFVAALRETLSPWSAAPAMLDWPSYASGRTRGLPWYLLSAKLVALAGYPVLMHGRNGDAAQLRTHLDTVDVPTVLTPKTAAIALEEHGIAYLPLEAMSPAADRLLGLRAALGLRSCMNTCLRMANPAQSETSVQGVFHPGYRNLQEEVAACLGDPATMILKGGGGEFERTPFKAVSLFGHRNGLRFPTALPGVEGTGRLEDVSAPDVTLSSLWTGHVRDELAENVTVGTAALALLALGHAETLREAETAATELWDTRHERKSAA